MNQSRLATRVDGSSQGAATRNTWSARDSEAEDPKYAQPLSLCPKFVAVGADPEGPFQLFAALSAVASQTKYISTDPPPPRATSLKAISMISRCKPKMGELTCISLVSVAARSAPKTRSYRNNDGSPTCNETTGSWSPFSCSQSGRDLTQSTPRCMHVAASGYC